MTSKGIENPVKRLNTYKPENSMDIKSCVAAVSSDRKEMSASETLRHDYNQTNCLGTTDRI